jgi:hypothetical protein
MGSRRGRLLLLGAGMVIVFASVAAILIRIIPAPRKETDYLVIGTLATFASLALLFVVLLNTYMKDPSAMFKRKQE